MADINTTHPTDEVASTTEATSDIADPVVETEALLREMLGGESGEAGGS